MRILLIAKQRQIVAKVDEFPTVLDTFEATLTTASLLLVATVAGHRAA